MITKTQIDKKIKRKRNIELIKIVRIAKKNNHLELAKKLLFPRRKKLIMNIGDIEKIKEDKFLFPGKILGSGEINKKVYVVALDFSKQAEEKLKKAGCSFKKINEELEINPKLEGIKIL